MGTVCVEGQGEGRMREIEGGENATMKSDIVYAL